ncbi:MAG: hypothetical protein IKA53_00770 [Clostridia bacterium]|nr:hypothetical protein [Clostridia bacterium]
MDKAAFARAQSAVLGEGIERDGIGTLSERALHRILKLAEEPDEALHEQKVLGSVADIKNESGIVEIQTRAFERMPKKLKKFLPEYPVKLLYPIARRKLLHWIDPETKEIAPARKSPKLGKPSDAFYELYKIRDFLANENLSVHLLFLDMAEYRYRNGYGKDKKRGAFRIERIPTAFCEEIVLEGREDYRIFLPEALGEEFTAKEYARAIGQKARYAYLGIRILKDCFGLISHVRTEGREYVYKIEK